jgi:ATP-dependent DNA helicase RecG
MRLTENGQLKRAALILFGKEPAKFYPNIFVKIGRFGNDDTDLKFQETEEANLILLLQSVLNQLNNKFLTRPIEFEGMYRLEKSEYPTSALREIILNALVHRNYMGSPTQIRVYDNKINFWNEGKLPEGLTLEALKGFHASRPRNVLIADVCFKGGFIDSWGRGTLQIYDACKQAELPEPEIKEFQGGFLVTLFKDKLTQYQLEKLGLNNRQLQAVNFVKQKGKITNKEYQELNETSDRTALRDLEKLTELGVFLKDGEKKGTFYKLKPGG